jgi:hypothetical protein
MHNRFALARHHTVHILRRSYRTGRKSLFAAEERSCPSFFECIWMLPGNSCVLPWFKCCSVTALSVIGHFGVLSSFERCSQQQPYLPMGILVSFPLLIVAPSDSLICPWTFRCPFLFWMLLPTTGLSANGHFGVFSSFECCSQWQAYLPLDISVSIPLCRWAQDSPLLIIIIVDVRTFVPFMVFTWHWKNDSALSLGFVRRTSPLRGTGWWPLGVAWLVTSFLSR